MQRGKDCNSFGKLPTTSANPPALENGATSAAANNIFIFPLFPLNGYLLSSFGVFCSIPDKSGNWILLSDKNFSISKSVLKFNPYFFTM